APASGGDTGSVSGYTTVIGTNGEGLRCRSAASYGASTITVIPEGTSVAMRGGAQGEWQPVVCAGMNGFAHASFLGSAGSTPQTPSAPVTTPAPTAAPPAAPSGFATGAHAKVNSSLNLRYQPHYNSGVAAVAEAGTVVLITGGGENGFYPVDWDGLYGYMHGDYLSVTSADLSERGGSAAPEPAPAAPPASNPGSSTGSAMASFALQYNGYPYAWATAGPYSFDCSGFTYWVTKNVVGIDIGRGLFTQVAAGTPVSRANLQPGDLVFFQNTYTWGLSHSGVYIGNGQMIHAENETTGVKISDINSDYYSSRWYGAVRLT
ncbi:MAG TPA: SH3 domain-containing C40 family peptidase, partial [Chloroflexota bacterium]|nr:SH3 domain-containing C40 family peptidase [Chloroflexota bacterium]